MAKKKPPGTKRIVDLDVSEFSPVDKPAIDEEFIIIKSLKGEAPMKITKKIIQKATSWQSSKTKSSEKKGELCVFCKQEGGSEPKIGLKCGVCFSCAVQREDKGVFDQCLEGTFDFEEYKTKFPDEFKTKSSDEDDGGDKNEDNETTSEDPSENEDDEQEGGKEGDSDSQEDVTDEEKVLTPKDSLSRDELQVSLQERSKKFGIEVRDDAALTFPAGFPNSLDEYGDPVNLKYPFDSKKRAANARVRFKQNATEYDKEKSKAIVHERIVRAELEFDIDPSFDENDPLDQLLPADLKEQLQKIMKGEKPSVSKRLSQVEKQFEELKSLLEQSLALHDEAARSLNQIVEMQMMALEQVLMLTDPDEQPDGQDGDVTAASRHTNLLGELKTLKAEVSKAGAKISTSRLRVLQEISEKLSDLIRSAMDGGKDGKHKSVNKSTDGLVGRLKTVESSIEAIRNEATNKVEALAKRIDEFENTAGASGALDDDEDSASEENSSASQKSIFAPLIGLDEIKMQIEKRDTYLRKDKTEQS